MKIITTLTSSLLAFAAHAQPVELLPITDFADCVSTAHYLEQRMIGSIEDKKELDSIAKTKLTKQERSKLNEITAMWQYNRQQLNSDVEEFKNSSCLGIKTFTKREALDICRQLPFGMTTYCKIQTQ